MVTANTQHAEDCACCKDGPEATNAREAGMMRTHGWYAHYVFDTAPPHYHTHGFPESFNHKDIQIMLPGLNPHIMHGIAERIVELIKEGKTFEPGQDYDGIAQGYKTRFILARECDRPVLRLIVPDKAGNLDQDKLEQKYAVQYEHLVTE